jgi:hypothetical protein
VAINGAPFCTLVADRVKVVLPVPVVFEPDAGLAFLLQAMNPASDNIKKDNVKNRRFIFFMHLSILRQRRF